MKKIIVANWKMNNSFEQADAWLEVVYSKEEEVKERLKAVEIILCPPVVMMDYIDSELMESGFQKLQTLLEYQKKDIADISEEELSKIVLSERPLRIGAQDCHFEESGSFTGDISAAMLKRVGCEYVILGHSERRTAHFETNEIVAKKVQAALDQNLIPIICVGEDQETRNANKHLEFVYRQIKVSIPQGVKFEKLIIAYEPIWSIGTGVTPTVEQISEMAKLIKRIFDEKLAGVADEYFMLYGGSVTTQNSAEILAIPNVNGLLVGKASLDAEEFLKICLS